MEGHAITAAVQYYNGTLIIRGELIHRIQDKLPINKKAKRPIRILGLANSYTKHSDNPLGDNHFKKNLDPLSSESAHPYKCLFSLLAPQPSLAEIPFLAALSRFFSPLDPPTSSSESESDWMTPPAFRSLSERKLSVS